MQVFLAMPSDCPVEPSGSKRNVPASATGRNSVSMYISDDEALSFSQVGGRQSLDSCSLLHMSEDGGSQGEIILKIQAYDQNKYPSNTIAAPGFGIELKSIPVIKAQNAAASCIIQCWQALICCVG